MLEYKEKSPKGTAENTSYGPDVKEALDQLVYPDASVTSMNYSPGYRPDQVPSSSNTPAPRTPNEPGTDQSQVSKESTIQKKVVKKIQAEGVTTLSNIEESDLSSISNIGGTSQINIMTDFANGENSEIKSKPSENTRAVEKRDIRAPIRNAYRHKDKSFKQSDEGAMFPKIQAPTVEISERTIGTDGSLFKEEYTARAGKGLECEESLSLTPSHASQSKSKGWTFTPQDLSTNRVERKDEGENDHTTSPDFLSNQGGRKKILSRDAKEDAKMNLDAEIQKQIADTESILSDDFHRLKVEVSQSKAQANSLAEENAGLKEELEIKLSELNELSEVFGKQSARIQELEEHIILLQQHGDSTKLPMLRGQALENARTEIAQLRIHLQERDKKIVALEHAAAQREGQQRADGKSMFKEINDLCAEVQKYKIQLSSITRQNQQLQNALNFNQNQNFEMQSQWDLSNKEVAQSMKTLEEERNKLEQAIKANESELSKEKKQKESLQKSNKELKEKYEKAFTELNSLKEEMEKQGEMNEEGMDKNSGYAEQLNQMKEQYNKRMQSMNDELIKVKDSLAKKDAQLSEHEKKRQSESFGKEDTTPKQYNPAMQELIQIKKLLEVKEEENLMAKIEEMLAEAEEARLIKLQHSRMEEALKEGQKTQSELSDQLAEERKRWTEVEAIENPGEMILLKKKIKELEDTQGQSVKSKNAIQTQLTNITETLKAKEQEIMLLKQSRDIAEGNEKKLKEDMEAMQNKMGSADKFKQELSKLMKGIMITLTFSFIETNYPVESADKLLEYLGTVKDNIEAHNTANIANIAALKEQIKLLEDESDNLKQNVVESQRKRINTLETEKKTMTERIAELEDKEKLTRKTTPKASQVSDENESQKLKKQLIEERAHNNEVLEQMREMHKAELDAANANKQIMSNQLEGKIKMLEEKLKQKKAKSVKKLNEVEETLKKQEMLLLENEKLSIDIKKMEKLCAETNAECETLKEKCAKAEERLRKEKGTVQQDLVNKDKLIQKLQGEKCVDNNETDLKSKLETLEKANKLSQQRLLQSYEENNEKIQDMQEKLDQSKLENKTLEDEKKGLIAECSRLQQLLDEAKTDMKKMMATTKKMNSVRNSISETIVVKPKAQETSAEEIKDNSESSIVFDDEILKLQSSKAGFKNDDDIIKMFDELLVSGECKAEAKKNPLAEEFKKRIEQVRKTTELKYAKEIEDLQRHLSKFAKIDASKRTEAPKTLQESIDLLKESLTESERVMEDNVRKKIIAERKRIQEEIRKTMSLEEISPSNTKITDPKRNPAHKPVSPNRISTNEQEYKREFDAINNEEGFIGTTRTISFGAPEPVDQDLDPQADDQSINNVIEECKKKLEEQKVIELEKEWKCKLKEHEEETAKIKAQMQAEIAQIKSECQSQLDFAKKQTAEYERKHKELEDALRVQYEENKSNLETDKEKEVEDLLKLKEKEIRANLNVEFMKTINSKKEELTKQYMESKEALVKDFDALKQKLYSELEAKTTKIEQEYNELMQESESRKMEAERKYSERIEQKEKLMDNVLKMRIKEIEDDYRVKAEKLEYNVKYEAQCQTERQRAELTSEQKGIEQRCKARIEELERKIRNSNLEYKQKIEQLETALKGAREEADQKCEQIKKKTEKDLNVKVDQYHKKYRESEEKLGKLKKELEEITKKNNEEKETTIESIQKKLKEEQKTLKDKHKAEIKSLKETHKNELIKKNIEKEREIKKLNEQFAVQLEQTTKQPEVKEAPKEEKKDNEKLLQQKINALKKKLETEYQEKEKVLKGEIDKKTKEFEETVSHKEKSIQEQMTLKFNNQLKEEMGKLKEKYREKKKKLEELRVEYENKLRSEMKENRMKDANSSMRSRKGNELTLSEIDSEEVVRENDEKLRFTEKMETDRQKIVEQYETKIKKLENELAITTSRTTGRSHETMQTFVEILTLELDKHLNHLKSSSGQKCSISTAEINHTIAKMVIALTPDGKCGELLETFKTKLNSVLFAFKRTLEQQYAKQIKKEQKAEELAPDEYATADTKRCFEVMDKGYEKNILTKISPIQNNNGKYVVDVEKVVRDLLLVKEALYSVFHKANADISSKGLEGTNCTILEELSKIQESDISVQTAIDNITKHYRILLNTILRFAVEAAWLANEGLKGNSVTKKRMQDAENEEMLKLRLINAELNERLNEVEMENGEHRKKLALFVGYENN